MHLLITCAEDVTSDLLCERLGNTVLRLNWERWPEYQVRIDQTGFVLSDRFGRTATADSLDNIIWRKPVPSVPTELGQGWYAFHEFRAGVLSILNWARRQPGCKLPIDPDYNATIDKCYQLRVASRYLTVAPWVFTSRPSKENWADRPWVVKSITGQPITGTGTPAKVIFTTAVEPEELSDDWPWFLQQRLDLPFDLTVLFVDGDQFAFLLDRSLFAGLDWRQAMGLAAVDQGWQMVDLPHQTHSKIVRLMGDLGLRFGRLDLLAANPSCAEPIFLEVNPNGQWAWLDPNLDNGLFDRVCTFLTGQAKR